MINKSFRDGLKQEAKVSLF